VAIKEKGQKAGHLSSDLKEVKEMKRHFVVLAAFFMVVVMASSARASAYYDIVPNLPDPYPVNTGDPFSVSIYIKGDGNSSYNNYTFDVAWDASELSLGSVDPLSAEEYWPAGWTDGFGGSLSYNASEGTIENFDGYSFTIPLVPDSNGTLLGTIDFTVLTPVGDGQDDVWVHYRTGQGPVLDSHGPDLAAVPIPGAIWLFGSGLLGLMGVRRRRKA
jgi:hypothetical protein